ncbi:MBL fold metallo-hydrolase [Streptomyces sp. NBC_01198]|uniref:MBL fold metallo-hydrolase n=1 Tax=Streptomyces sp. NBC_01198 TaxID=2903769 RepID=UPI002E0E33A5|nr:MBL fold metallo-hydrolase [Streptomyces sp. NBC_01198]
MTILAPGVIQIATSKSNNAFLVEGDDGLTLVDVGSTKAVDPLLRTIAELGRDPGDLNRIVLTHAHPDHVQGAPTLREHTGARVLIHVADAAWLAGGRVPADGRSSPAARRYDQLPAAHWTPFEPDATVEDGELIAGSGGLRVIHTPGHSPGHIALLHEPTRTVLVGDAVFHAGRLGYGPATFAAEPAARATGAARIPTNVTAVGFGHGAPLSGPEVDAFQAFLAKQQ